MATGKARAARKTASGVRRQKAGTPRAPSTDDPRRSEQLLRLEHGITLRLAESAGGAHDTVNAALREVCRIESWDVAEFWLVDETEGVLRRFEHWASPGMEAARVFVDAGSTLALKPGEGLAGAVWQSGEPDWIADLMTDARAVRRDVSRETGLHAALLFPVRYGGRVVGVLSFTCSTIRRPDQRLLQSLNVIGTQIGQFLQRTQAEQALRESEARFRSLTELSSDWYWEQDANLRFTRLEGRNIAGGDRALQRRLIGATRWDSGLEVEGGWDAHRKLLEARKPFFDVLMWRTGADRSVRYMTISGGPIFNDDGRFTGYRGIGRDATAQKRAEQLLRLEHHVGRSLADAEDGATGLRAVLRTVCEVQQWACGRYFDADDAAGVLCMREAWGIADPTIAQFIERSRQLAYRRGEGLSGRAWETGEALWSTDTALDRRVHAKHLADGAFIRSAFVFPVTSAGRTLGVLAFAGRQAREPDERLLQAGQVISTQVGQFLQRKQAEEALRESEARFRELTQMSSDFFWETDAAHRFTEMVHGPNYLSRFGPALVGKTAWELPYSAPDETAWAKLRAAFDAHEPFRDFEFARAWPDSSTRYFSVSGQPRFAADGCFLGYRGVGREITEIALARERIASLAFSDPLTGLANRTSLGPAFDQAVERARRRGGKLAAMFIDLDGFKPVNDVHGHQAGDRLLAETARRLRSSLRASDMVARLGGDEFFVVLEDMPTIGRLETIARKLLAEIQRPYNIVSGQDASISASMGISIFPDDATDSAALMKNADTAMYEAKQSGKNGFRFYARAPSARKPGATD